jgi:hypothetical protein
MMARIADLPAIHLAAARDAMLLGDRRAALDAHARRLLVDLDLGSLAVMDMLRLLMVVMHFGLVPEVNFFHDGVVLPTRRADVDLPAIDTMELRFPSHGFLVLYAGGVLPGAIADSDEQADGEQGDHKRSPDAGGRLSAASANGADPIGQGEIEVVDHFPLRTAGWYATRVWCPQ